MAKRTIKIGDIIEIPTKRGKGYAQLSHYQGGPLDLGALLRVLPGLFPQRPKDLASLVKEKASYSTFFSLQGAVNRGTVQIIGNNEVPVHAKEFPLFRCAGLPNPATGQVEQWWLWDGVKEWRIGKLSDDQLDLPIRALWTDAILIDRIESGWLPRMDKRCLPAKRRSAGAEPSEASGAVHFLVLKNRSDAETASQRVGELSIRTEIEEMGENVVVRAYEKSSTLGEPERLRRYLNEVAQVLGGYYDGVEHAVPK